MVSWEEPRRVRRPGHRENHPQPHHYWSRCSKSQNWLPVCRAYKRRIQAICERTGRAAAGRSLAKEPLAIQPVLEETLRQAHQLDPKRQITLDVSPGLSIRGDRDAFKQVLLILLDNALKHSDGEIHVKAGRKDGQLEIRVQDHGPGIPPEKLERVFDRFYRGEDSPITPGFGLGLPIAKTLVDGMDGTIAIESEVGQGSSVYVCFPALDKK